MATDAGTFAEAIAAMEPGDVLSVATGVLVGRCFAMGMAGDGLYWASLDQGPVGGCLDLNRDGAWIEADGPWRPEIMFDSPEELADRLYVAMIDLGLA